MTSEDTDSSKEFDPLISINVVYIDYSMFYRPGSRSEIEDDGIIELIDSPSPVVRIFGSTCGEKRACVHIHGVRTISTYICIKEQSPYPRVLNTDSSP
jgi:hypothetical protein